MIRNNRFLACFVAALTFVVAALIFVSSATTPSETRSTKPAPINTAELEGELAALRSEVEALRFGSRSDAPTGSAELHELTALVARLSKKQSEFADELARGSAAPTTGATAEADGFISENDAAPEDPMHLAALAADDLLLDEPVDGNWAIGAEEDLLELARSGGVPSAEVTCQSTLCRLDLRPDGDDEEFAVRNIYHSFSGDRDFLVAIDPDGRTQIWIAREGEMLPTGG